MTLTEIENLEKEYLTPVQVAPLLGVNPYTINKQFEEDKEALGFNVAKIGKNIRIPRIGFINFMKGETHGRKKQDNITVR